MLMSKNFNHLSKGALSGLMVSVGIIFVSKCWHLPLIHWLSSEYPVEKAHSLETTEGL